MGGIWGDGLFYLYASGFLITFVAFLFLLGKYRAAMEAGDDLAEAVASPVPAPIPSVPVVSNIVPPPVEKPVTSTEKTLVMERKPEPAPEPKPEPKPTDAGERSAGPAPKVETPAYTGPERRKADTTGGLSPAVVYLQNIKGQMEKFDKDIANLKQLSAQQAAQGEAILQRLAALADIIQDLKAAPAAAPAPAPAPELTAEETFTIPQTPEPAAESERAAAPEPKAEAVPPNDKTLVIERSSVPPPKAEAKAEATQPTTPLELKLPDQPLPQAEPAAEPPKPRKGPVWPV